MIKLEERCCTIEDIFNVLAIVSGRNDKCFLVEQFKIDNLELKDDFLFCLEVLAGKHKLGYTYASYPEIIKPRILTDFPMFKTIRELVEYLQGFSPTYDDNVKAYFTTPPECRHFIQKLVNRGFRLGYSGREDMMTAYSPMLAKRYPDSVHEGDYYIQEKLDGNRCIAVYNYDSNVWEFWSRSGKPLKVNFDMSWAKRDDFGCFQTFDGEIMTLAHAGTRDFTKTSGAINSKYGDKSKLHYYIYDIVDNRKPYEARKNILDIYAGKTGDDCSILPVLDKISVYRNPDYNWKLDELLDVITSKGGEGIMLRDPNAVYQIGKRSDALLKYKKVQTMDLRIVDWNPGNGKYEGAIGSFVCETDDGKISVNVAGMSDDIRWSDPEEWLGQIIEVAYFDVSKSQNKDTLSLRFPRMKRVRDDKTTTSIY